MTGLPSHYGLTRRSAITAAVAATAGAMFTGTSTVRADEVAIDPQWKITKGNINQSVVHWCYDPMTVEELAIAAAAMGVKSVELVDPQSWPILKKHGLTCAIASSHGFVRGWNDKANHDFCREKINASLTAAVDFGCPSVITFSGMRGNLTDEEGKANMVEGIKTIIGQFEKNKINLCIEPLNTRVDIEMKGHPGYQCDTVEWAVDVIKAVGSPNLKILFDVYHTQIMEGDVITRLKLYKDFIGHYHTAGVPGRNELDDNQEVNYPAIMKAIAETGYKGFVGQEYIPTWKDKVASLRHGVKLCDV